MPPKGKRVARKPGAGKRKKLSAKELARKAEADAELARQKVVKAAEVEIGADGKPTTTVKDVFSGMTPFHSFSKGGLDLEVEFTHPGAMEDATKNWCLDLVRSNMKEQYIAAHWGWSDGEKRKELEDSHARYLICRTKGSAASGAGDGAASGAAASAGASASASAGDEAEGSETVSHDSKGELVGFVHFRFMLEGTAPVLYVFELQTEARVRGKGLGSFLMRSLEFLAYQEHMQYVMLTVFNSNAGAQRFYSRLGYELDELSKSPAMLTSSVTYKILSKTIDPEIARAKTTRHKALQGKVDVEKLEAVADGLA